MASASHTSSLDDRAMIDIHLSGAIYDDLRRAA